MFKGRNVLVTGSEGLIGKELIQLLKEQGAKVVGLDIKNGINLTNYWTCLIYIKDADYIFHLAGIKGSPKMTNEQPVSFMGPMLQFDTNMIMAAQKNNVKGFLYTSSIAVENPETDKYPAWAKMTAETLIEAMRIQYPEGTKYCVVRPANVYGKHDNFDNPNAMVITSLINKGLNDAAIEVWGDGSEERDFIHAKDVARGMILAMENMQETPINLCSGEGHTIREVAETVAEETGKGINYKLDKKTGAQRRIMKSNGELIGFKPEIILKDGIKEAIRWIKKQQ